MTNYTSLQSTIEKDILWRLLHWTLPTQVNLCRWSLASSSNCPACHVQQDTSDHVFGSCAIWKDVLQNDLSLLRRSNVVTTQNEQSHVFDLLLETGYLQHFFAILLTTFWLQRKLLPQAILACFKWRLKQHVKIEWTRTPSKQNFTAFWTPIACDSQGKLSFNDTLQ